VRVGDVTALVDYAHNPVGLTALLDAARAMPAARRPPVLGQAGDRDDGAIADLARVAWTHGTVDRVLLKEVPAMQRGRPPGAVPRVLAAALAAAGAPAEAIDPRVAATEPEAVTTALRWARTGTLLVLPLHTDRAELVECLRAVDAAGWRAGAELPPWRDVAARRRRGRLASAGHRSHVRALQPAGWPHFPSARAASPCAPPRRPATRPAVPRLRERRQPHRARLDRLHDQWVEFALLPDARVLRWLVRATSCAW
jgi:hypothetical protein